MKHFTEREEINAAICIERHAMTLVIVMAGLVPAIHVFDWLPMQGVDVRHKAGHD